jgi:radical SAM protein with 4Fe4S-binding SPASM domain
MPCGGLILLSRLLSAGRLKERDLEQANLFERSAVSYVRLTPRCSIKTLEEKYVYHLLKDELYEINEEGLQMLLLCDGTHRLADLNPDPEFLIFCLEEDLLEFRDVPQKIDFWEGRSPTPSLRYLEWLVTFRCNLSCAHCYLGALSSNEFPVELIEPLLMQFSRMQGLRILVSGGEPTLYRHFHVLNHMVRQYPIRSVLLSNGMILDDELASRLNFSEVQISLDGTEKGHDLIRGKGSFKRAVAAMEAVRKAGLDLSVATMIHKGNREEWLEMQRLVTSLAAREWSIDYPCIKGRWESHPELWVGPEEAAEKMRFSFGGSYHGTSPGWTCGRHLAAVLPSGELCRCGLFAGQCYGSIGDGLAEAWMRVKHLPIEGTKCHGCQQADLCGGGCRFRAGGPEERDELMCWFHRVSARGANSIPQSLREQ